MMFCLQVLWLLEQLAVPKSRRLRPRTPRRGTARDLTRRTSENEPRPTSPEGVDPGLGCREPKANSKAKCSEPQAAKARSSSIQPRTPLNPTKPKALKPQSSESRLIILQVTPNPKPYVLHEDPLSHPKPTLSPKS